MMSLKRRPHPKSMVVDQTIQIIKVKILVAVTLYSSLIRILSQIVESPYISRSSLVITIHTVRHQKVRVLLITNRVDCPSQIQSRHYHLKQVKTPEEKVCVRNPVRSALHSSCYHRVSRAAAGYPQ